METLVTIHSYWRWLVLLAAVEALAVTARSRRGAAPPWTGRVGLIYTITFDIQVLIGLILWFGEGRYQSGGFYGLVHPVLMLLAMGLAHMGRGRLKRARGGALAAYAASLALVLLGIPWSS